MHTVQKILGGKVFLFLTSVNMVLFTDRSNRTLTVLRILRNVLNKFINAKCRLP